MLSARLSRAAGDRSGAVAVEFAFIAPLMILLFFGLAQLSQAIVASRHANHSSSSVGDLVAQCANINDQDLSNIFYAGADIMTPLPVSPSLIQQTLTSVKAVDSTPTMKVQWSEKSVGVTSNGATTYQAAAGPYAPNAAPPALPANITSGMAQGDSLIVAETTYSYTFPFTGGGLLPLGKGQQVSLSFGRTINFDVVTYFKPRKSSVVTYTGTGPGGANAGGSTEGTSCYAS